MQTIKCKAGTRTVTGILVYWLRDPRTDSLLEIAGGRIDQIPDGLRRQMEAAQGQEIDIAEADLAKFASIYNEMMEACTPKHTENHGHKFNKSWSRQSIQDIPCE